MNLSERYPFLTGGGEMGERIRAFDWSATSLGTPDTWPQSLRTTLSILLGSKFPMFMYWGPDYVCFYNDYYKPSFGQMGKHPQALGKPAIEVWPELWNTTMKVSLELVTNTGEAIWGEDMLVPIERNGRLEDAYWTFSYGPIRDESGSIAGIFATILETTAKVEAINQLETHKDELQFALEAAELGTFDLNPKTNHFRANDRLRNWFGLASSEDVLLDTAIRSIIPADRQRVIDAITWALNVASGGNYAIDYTIDNGQPDGKRLVNAKGKVWFTDDHEPYRFNGTVEDITEKRQAEQLRQASETKFRALIEEAPVATCLFVGRDMVIDVANPVMLSYWGKGNSVLGKPLVRALPELVGQPFPAILDTIYTTGETFEARDARAELVVNGVQDTYYFDFTYKPLLDASGQVYAIMDMAVDVTEQVLAKQRLNETRATLHDATELAELAIWELDTTTGQFTISERLSHWYEISERTLSIPRKLSMLLTSDRDRLENAFRYALRDGGDGLLDEELTLVGQQTGRLRSIRTQARAYFDPEGKPIKMLGTVQDITRQRQFQQELTYLVEHRTHELSQANQDLTRSNENLQRFAYVASHDLQEPLRKIQQFGDLLQAYFPASASTELNYLSRMQSAANRMSTLIRDLLTFSRISTRRDTSGPVALNTVLSTALADLELVIEETGATVDVASLPTVTGDEGQLGQLFLNLLSNALKFRQPNVPAHVQVTVETIPVDQLPPTVKPASAANAYYRIDVTDNGIGFDEKYLDRIFQVFQRLHGRSEYAGTGIGLAISEKVVTNHGGAITARSQPGEGASFSVFLPVPTT